MPRKIWLATVATPIPSGPARAADLGAAELEINRHQYVHGQRFAIFDIRFEQCAQYGLPRRLVQARRTAGTMHFRAHGQAGVRHQHAHHRLALLAFAARLRGIFRRRLAQIFDAGGDRWKLLARAVSGTIASALSQVAVSRAARVAILRWWRRRRHGDMRRIAHLYHR